MKTITLTQPWATLVAIGAKRIETRSWSTKYRGPLAIHAAKGWTPEVMRLAMTVQPFKGVLSAAGYTLFSQLPRGVIVATCTLSDVQEAGKVMTDEFFLEHEYEFGDYTYGRFAWLLTDVQELPTPMPARGALGLWECAL